jgi:hypothetical protein
MTKQLSELFDLPETPSHINQPDPVEISQEELVDEISENTASILDKIDEALPQVKGLDASDNEMDELASLATNSYKELMDLGMQVDSRFASEIFNSAGTMLGHAITAKTAKINKKLKMIDLQLKKVSVEQKNKTTNDNPKDIDNTPVGEGGLLDRNELLRAILANKKPDQ